MKSFFVLILFARMTLTAQNSHVESGVYRWNDLESGKQGKQDVRRILEGKTGNLDALKVDISTIPTGAVRNMDSVKDTVETLIIIKEGKFDVCLGEKQRNLGPKSVVMIMPGDAVQYQNTGTVPATFYLLEFKARKSVESFHADGSGESFMIDFEDLEFKPHDKGGLRQYYRGPTAMFNHTEMHVTTLNAQNTSHEPHAHGSEEIVLMISGNTKMRIESKFYAAAAGDLYYLESNASHAIQNARDESCMYYAFQWE